MNITIVSSSPRQQSVTVRVAKFLQQYLSEKYPQHQYTILKLSEHPLPFVEDVWSTPAHAPEQYRNLASLVFATDAFVIVTPEYNGGYSVAMKNLFDHFPKQTHKTFGIVTASDGALGGMRAAQQMQNMICGLFGIPCPNMLIVPAMTKKFDAEGKLIEESFTNAIHTFAHEFLWLAEAVYTKKVK
ncbi:MAG: NAD(P)H-dependent oxidoreductase [Chitinophagales bacterium]|nr:NAD(P)H-dependent oxidoreductase [Chitinophagales bacterium]